MLQMYDPSSLSIMLFEDDFYQKLDELLLL